MILPEVNLTIYYCKLSNIPNPVDILSSVSEDGTTIELMYDMDTSFLYLHYTYSVLIEEI